MSRTKLFDKAFDEGTLIKLTLFEHYLLEWLPVFLTRKVILFPVVNIFDFFAGPGCDINGAKGSPMIILDSIQKYSRYIVEKKLTVNVYLNEFNLTQYNQLAQHLQKYQEIPYIRIFHYQEDFKELFAKLYPQINQRDSANLVFLDQYGIKQITREIFLKLVVASSTDFMFYISSSFFSRFSEHDAFTKHLAINKEDIESNNYYNIHRTIFKHYKSLIPFARQYYLAPFSIKKESNIYGLVFGSSHTLGIEKFLIGCWKLDKIRGEANFDIDNDGEINGQMDMFTNSVIRPKKIEHFENRLRELIKSKELKSDYQVYEFGLLNGFLPKHANPVIKQMITEKVLKSKVETKSGDIHKIKSSPTTLII